MPHDGGAVTELARLRQGSARVAAWSAVLKKAAAVRREGPPRPEIRLIQTEKAGAIRSPTHCVASWASRRVARRLASAPGIDLQPRGMGPPPSIDWSHGVIRSRASGTAVRVFTRMLNQVVSRVVEHGQPCHAPPSCDSVA